MCGLCKGVACSLEQMVAVCKVVHHFRTRSHNNMSIRSKNSIAGSEIHSPHLFRKRSTLVPSTKYSEAPPPQRDTFYYCSDAVINAEMQSQFLLL